MSIKKEIDLPRFGEEGQASRLLLVLAIVVFVAGVIVYLVLKMAAPAPKQAPIVNLPPTTVPSSVTQKQLSNIQFVVQSAINKGSVLSGAGIPADQYGGTTQDMNADPGGKFLDVTVGAQNEGVQNTVQGAWDIGNIIDSQGRNFIPLDSSTVAPWLPNPDSCGALLRPAFNPIPCVKIYEVSNLSTGLKINVEDMENPKKPVSTLLDLNVQ